MNLHQSKLYFEDIDRTLRHVVGMEKLFGKSVLITGATGTIGSFVADTLIRFNHQNAAKLKIYLAGRDLEKLRMRFEECENIDFLIYDMESPIKFEVSVDYIIHAAGNAHPAAFNGDPVGTIIGNVESTFALLEYLKKHCGKRLLYVSSGEVYGQGDVSISAFKEEYAGYVNALSPRSCYPLSKRTTENLCVSYWKQYGGETVIVRPCHTYGPCMTTTDNRAHVQFFHNALDGEDILLKSAGRQMRSYNYVADCVGLDLDNLLRDSESIEENEFIKEIKEIKNSTLFLYIGVLEERRNILFLLEVFQKVSKQIENSKLIIIGKGKQNYVAMCKEKLIELGLENDVIYREKLEQKYMPAIYQASDAFLLPTRYEIFGMVLLEAMYYGLPVFTTYNGGSSTLINNENGIIIENTDCNEWSEKIVKVLSDKKECDAIGEKAHRTVEKNYTWDALANKFLSVYEKRLRNTNE